MHLHQMSYKSWITVLQLQTIFFTVLHVVVDSESRFIFVDIGAYGKQSDGHTFSASTLYRFLEDSEYNFKKTFKFLFFGGGGGASGTEMPFVILGDEACPLKTINEVFREEESVT
jgi:hypothetical protein